MKILLSILICLISVFKIQAAPVVASPWTITTNPATARDGLGIGFGTGPFLVTNDNRTALWQLSSNQSFGIDTITTNISGYTTNCSSNSIITVSGAGRSAMNDTYVYLSGDSNLTIYHINSNITQRLRFSPNGSQSPAALYMEGEYPSYSYTNNVDITTGVGTNWKTAGLVWAPAPAPTTTGISNCVVTTNASSYTTNTIRLKNGQVILNGIVFDGSGATSGVSAATVYNILGTSNLVNVPDWQATNTWQSLVNTALSNKDSSLTANLTTVSNLAATNMLNIVFATNVLKSQLTIVSNLVATNYIDSLAYTSSLPANVGNQIASSNLVLRFNGTATNLYLDNAQINHFFFGDSTNTGAISLDYSAVDEPPALVGVGDNPNLYGVALPIGSVALVEDGYPFVKTGAVNTAWEKLATVKNVINATNTLMNEIRYKVRDLSTNATLGVDYNFILVNTAAGNINVTLPSSPPDGFYLQIANVGAFGLYIIPNAGQTIDGSGSSLYVPTIQSTRGLMFHGTNWKRF